MQKDIVYVLVSIHVFVYHERFPMGLLDLIFQNVGKLVDLDNSTQHGHGKLFKTGITALGYVFVSMHAP